MRDLLSVKNYSTNEVVKMLYTTRQGSGYLTRELLKEGKIEVKDVEIANYPMCISPPPTSIISKRIVGKNPTIRKMIPVIPNLRVILIR